MSYGGREMKFRIMMSKIIIDDPHSDPGYRYSSKTSANDTTGQ